MFDEKEIEELYDEFLNLDGNVFPVSEEDIKKLECDDVNLNFIKKFPNLKNNNFIGDGSDVNLDYSNATTRLDLLNENFITLSPYESDRNSENVTTTGGKPVRSALLFDKKEDEVDNEFKEIDEKLTSPDAPAEKKSLHRSGWPSDSLGLWHSGPSSLNLGQPSHNHVPQQDLTSSIAYSSYEPQHTSMFSSSSKRTYSHQQLGAKVEMVYSLLSMLDTDNREDMSKTFLAMSSSPESCHAMRQSGCLPLLIQLIHSSELNKEVRQRAAEALHNVVHAQTDEKRRRREVRVLKLLQQTREYCDDLKCNSVKEGPNLEDSEKHPINAIGTLMKYSFDAEHRQAICILGGLHAIAELIQVDHEAHGSINDDSLCITLRRYAGMSLTNLTFGDGKNKALLCSFNKFMRALVDQLKSPSEDLRQVTASVLRNLSWRADSESKQALRNVGAVTALTASAMEAKKESTLKSILSALWNLSAHCSLNKIDICSVPGALAFLVKMLRYKSSSNTLAIVENAGGILRNISSHIAVREDYRQILRDNNCFEVLLEQLKSPSLTIVSNACGTLWNLSARCPEDQKKLWEMGATGMLRSLVQSKHKMISMGSSAALKNLLAANPNENLLAHLDSTAKSLGLQNLPTLFVRKKRALEQELNITLADTCENIDCIGSPTHSNSFAGKPEEKTGSGPVRSDSHDSVQSSQSDSVYERINQIAVKNEENLLENKTGTLHQSLDEKLLPRKVEDQKLIRRYKTSMIPTPTFKKMNQDRINEKTKEETVAEDAGNDTVVETKERVKKGIPVLESRLKGKTVRNGETPDGLSSSVSSQSSRDSLIKSKESEFFEGKDLEKCERLSDADARIGDLEFGGGSSSTCKAQSIENREECDKANSRENERYERELITDAINDEKYSATLSLEENKAVRSNNPPLETIEGKRRETTDCNSNKELSNFDSNERSQTRRTEKGDESLEREQASAPEPADKTCADSVEDFSDKAKDEFERKFMNDDSKASTGSIFPKFKVGSPITDSRVLQMEAKKICHEIKKHQDLEMGCSLTSEVSLISCSSFLDTGDYSLFDSSTDGVDFDDSDNPLVRSKLKNCYFRKPTVQTTESVSLPSLGSLKNDQIEALDLDNSVLSVASITSEIAETCQKDPEMYNTYTKTYKNDTQSDFLEETLADVTLVSNDNDTLQADSMHDAELCDEDNSLHCQEELPFDSENLRDDSAERMKRKLTPKEKRKTFQERYRTYTIRDFKGCKGPGVVTGQDAPVAAAIDDSPCFVDNQSTDEYGVDASVFCKNETIQFSKSFDDERGTVPSFLFDSRSLNDLLSVGPAERKELVDNAKLVAFSLKTAVHDFEPISDSETEEFHKSLDIDTATYSKHNRDRSLGKFSSERLEYLQQDKELPEEEDVERKGARISKPTDNPEEKLEDLPKGIRGRRKPLYSSPQKHFQRTNSSSLDPPKKPPPAVKTETKNSVPEASTSPVLHREGTFTKESGSPVKNETKSIPVLCRNVESRNTNPGKSVYRNKSAPSVNAKRSGEAQVSKIGRPLSTYASRNSDRRAESNSSQRRPFSAETTNRNGGDGASLIRRPASTGLASPKMRISSSNQNIRAGYSPGSSSKSKQATLQSSKSQSDASLHLVAHKDKVSAAKQKEPKREVTSKIASLWRKVEETKQKNKNAKDNRVWIGPEKKSDNADEVLVIEQEEILDIPTRKIVHSFTSQTLADETYEFNSQERDSRGSRDFPHGGGSAERTNRNERRKIISAIVPPYNYSPPVPEQVIPSSIKRVDSFQKDSLKVTAV